MIRYNLFLLPITTLTNLNIFMIFTVIVLCVHLLSFFFLLSPYANVVYFFDNRRSLHARLKFKRAEKRGRITYSPRRRRFYTVVCIA